MFHVTHCRLPTFDSFLPFPHFLLITNTGTNMQHKLVKQINSQVKKKKEHDSVRMTVTINAAEGLEDNTMWLIFHKYFNKDDSSFSVWHSEF